eukprot:12035130-Alexandrium_andersonii.AAC.1
MSASLVGSEMCIRDRFGTHSDTAAASSAGAPAGGVESATAGGPPPGVGAVSYTHLTLPTICSV